MTGVTGTQNVGTDQVSGERAQVRHYQLVNLTVNAQGWLDMDDIRAATTHTDTTQTVAVFVHGLLTIPDEPGAHELARCLDGAQDVVVFADGYMAVEFSEAVHNALVGRTYR